MKWWHVLLAVIGIYLLAGLVLPPRIRCKMQFWNKNACQQTEQAIGDLQKFGVDINPDMPFVTQLDEFA